MKKSILIFLMISSILFTACGNTILKIETMNSTQNNSSENSEIVNSIDRIREFSLPYYQNDSLYPYSAKTLQNFSLRTLIYDSLFIYNGTKAENLIASSIVQNESSAVITLKNDAFFSDASPVRPEDVVNSYNLAKNSPIYAPSLTEIKSMRVFGENSIQIELSKPSPLLVNVLGFPIVKEVSGKFIGSGRFYLASNNLLLKNPYNKTKIKTVEKIHLKPINDIESLNFALADGSVSLYYSDSSAVSDIGLGVGFKQIPLNNLVFLEFNKARINTTLRNAIYQQIDRQKIAQTAYDNFATPVLMPFRKITSINNSNFSPETLLTSNGFSYDENKNLIFNFQKVRLNLLVSKDKQKVLAAKLIKESLEKLGIEINIESVDSDVYLRRVQALNYDMYLGEVKLSDDEDLSPILNSGQDSELLKQYYKYQNSEISLEQFYEEFTKTMPFSPILFRNATLFYNRSFQAVTRPNANDIFYNIEDW